MDITKKRRTMEFAAKYSIYLITVLFMCVCALLNDKFLSPLNLVNIVRQVSVYAMIGFAETILIVSGNLDLCAGSTCCVSGIVGLMVSLSTGSPILGSVAAMLTGVAINAVSAAFVAFFRLPPFVATLGMQMAVRGLALAITGGAVLTKTSENFRFIGQGFIFEFIPVSVVIMLASGFILWLILDRTRLGRNFYAMGGNREAARACGINLDRNTIYAYLIAGLFVGMSGIMYASRINAGAPAGATGYEGQGIAAAVIGGVGFAGGTGSAWGAIIGAIILGIINNILNLVGVDSYIQQIINGLIIIAAVGLDTFARSMRVSK